jgi:hypothetical protein
MTSDSGLLGIFVAVAWFGAGILGVVTALRHRAYVNSLPPTVSNLKIKRQNRAWLIGGVVMIAIGLWNTYLTLGT